MSGPAPLPALDPEDRLTRASGQLRVRMAFDRLVGFALPLLFIVAILPIADLAYYVASQALPTLSWSVISSFDPRAPDALGVVIVSTLEVMAVATGVATLLGVVGGIATAEFLPARLASAVRLSANLLVGTPSIILGYFGYFAFVLYFGWGLSFLAGAVTLAFFMTPYIFRSVDLAFASVPPTIREASYGAGSRPVDYLLRVAMPIAFPQVLTGVFLAMAIGVGETAPLVLTMEPGLLLPQTLLSPSSFLTVSIWEDFTAPSGTGLRLIAFQVAFLLFVGVVVLNVVVRIISARYQRRLRGLYQ